MARLEDFASGLLPATAGPGAEAIAAAAGELLSRMPATQRAAVSAGLATLDGAALLRHGGRFGTLPAASQAELLRRVASSGSAGTALIDLLKTVALLGWGQVVHGDEIRETANRHDPRRPDPQLDLRPGSEWPDESRCDVVVIGSGAGGAFAARSLARAGLDVVIVEEGSHWGVAKLRTSGPLDRFGSLYRDAGATIALGKPPIVLPIGRAVGGTTVVNSGTCYRPPAAVARAWHERHGLLPAAPDRLEPHLDDVESTLSVGPVPADVMGRNGELTLAGAAALGWEAGPLVRNAPGCRGSCQCSLGCPNNAKAGVHLNALPQACEAGARIVSELRVERVLSESGRTTGVLARRRDGSRLRIHARRVVVAAGTTETPPLLRRSRMGRHPRLGRGLSIHPAIGVSGSFAEPVFAWRGVLQSAGVEELHRSHGIMIEATSTPAGMGSMVVPGIGAELLERLEGGDHVATVGALLADPPTGVVHGSRVPLITYRVGPSGRARLRIAVGAMARILFAAGAERVDLGAGEPELRDVGELDHALERLDVGRLHLAAFHPTGTAAAGADRARHPVAADGSLRGIGGVWVADGSILPGCPTVNPQISIMALALGVAESVAA